MNEKTLFILALACTLFGILIILIISNSIEIKSTLIKDITEDNLGKEIKVTAEISAVQSTPGLYILTLKDNSSEIKAVIFKNKDLDFKVGDRIEVIGEVIKYKDALEIQLNELKTL